MKEISINMSPCDTPESTQKLFPNKSYIQSAKNPFKEGTTESTTDTYHSFQTEFRLQILPVINPRLGYLEEIISNLRRQEEEFKVSSELILKKHKISANLRAKMVDWIVEVICKAECIPQTFFRSVAIMDRFLQCTKNAYKSSSIQLIGVVSMLLASKFEEVSGMDITFMYSQVVHKKITQKEMADFEIEMIRTLGFTVLVPTEFEFVETYIENLGGGLGTTLAQAQHIATLNLHSLEISGIKPSLRAAANLYISTKEALASPSREIMKRLSLMAGTSVECIEGISKKIEQHRKDFKKLYPKLKNAINYIP